MIINRLGFTASLLLFVVFVLVACGRGGESGGVGASMVPLQAGATGVGNPGTTGIRSPGTTGTQNPGTRNPGVNAHHENLTDATRGSLLA